MSNYFTNTQVASSIPFDTGTGFTSVNLQDAVLEAKNTAPGTGARYLVLCSNPGKVVSGTYLYIAYSQSSGTSPLIVPEISHIKALSLSVTPASTGTIGVYVNSVLITSITINNSTSAYLSGLSLLLNPGDQISTKGTSGTCTAPLLSIFIQTG